MVVLGPGVGGDTSDVDNDGSAEIDDICELINIVTTRLQMDILPLSVDSITSRSAIAIFLALQSLQ